MVLFEGFILKINKYIKYVKSYIKLIRILLFNCSWKK